MTNKVFMEDDYIEKFGTEEQKKELHERRERLDRWVNQFAVMTMEEALKRSFDMEKYK